MTDIDNFKQVMKQWIAVDNKIRSANATLKTWRNERSQLSQNACSIIQSNHWETKKIEAPDSQISFTIKKEYPPLTFAFIEKHLADIVPDPEHIKVIISHLKSKREPKSMPDLKRIISGNNGGYETE